MLLRIDVPRHVLVRILIRLPEQFRSVSRIRSLLLRIDVVSCRVRMQDGVSRGDRRGVPDERAVLRRRAVRRECRPAERYDGCGHDHEIFDVLRYESRGRIGAVLAAVSGRWGLLRRSGVSCQRDVVRRCT